MDSASRKPAKRVKRKEAQSVGMEPDAWERFRSAVKSVAPPKKAKAKEDGVSGDLRFSTVVIALRKGKVLRLQTVEQAIDFIQSFQDDGLSSERLTTARQLLYAATDSEAAADISKAKEALVIALREAKLLRE